MAVSCSTEYKFISVIYRTVSSFTGHKGMSKSFWSYAKPYKMDEKKKKALEMLSMLIEE